MVAPRQIILLPEPLADVRDAYERYESQSVGLGEEFLRCLEVGFARIAENPLPYPLRFDTFRRVLLQRFPYAVYYEFTEATVTVYYVPRSPKSQSASPKTAAIDHPPSLRGPLLYP